MKRRTRFDPIELEIFKSLYSSVAEEMGVVLRRSAFSANIKERRDYSCAVFDRRGTLIAQGDHMPVHLGSMPLSVRAALDATALGPGDVVVLNDPYAGGTHLPDVTMVSAVFGPEAVPRRGDAGTRRHGDAGTRGRGDAGTRRHGDAGTRGRGDAGTRGRGRAETSESGYARTALRYPEFASPRLRVPASPRRSLLSSPRPLFYVANRAHHADIGGAHPGSMGACTEIFQEGMRIPPVKLMRGGIVDRDLLHIILQNVRSPSEREGDLTAQLGAMRVGERRLGEIVQRYGFRWADLYAGGLVRYAAERMRRTLKRIPDGEYSAEDFLDDDGESSEPVRIAVRIRIRGARALIDFTGSSPQVRGPVNAVEAITLSAVYYVFRCLVPDDIPASAGILQPLEIIAPVGTVVNATPPAPVAGGNVETSQRIVDVLLKALAPAVPAVIPAASQGTMNNLSFGGIDPVTGRSFAYYETIAGGMGARPAADGLSGIHTHMTNSLNTPTEALEYAYPIRVHRYSLRKHSGGRGAFTGGDGVIREIEFLTDAHVSLLSDRRRFAPYGLRGGKPGKAGRTKLVSNGKGRWLPGKFSLSIRTGDRICIETPGGGGHGTTTGHGLSSRKRFSKILA